jgi:hypothetical protein
MISQTRWSTTQTSNANFSASFLGQNSSSGTISGNVGGQIGVDEFVFDASSGALASFHEPPALASLLNSNSGCSFII